MKSVPFVFDQTSNGVTEVISTYHKGRRIAPVMTSRMRITPASQSFSARPMLFMRPPYLPDARLRPPLRGPVRGDDQAAADQPLEEADRRRDRVLEPLDALPIDPGIDDVADA